MREEQNKQVVREFTRIFKNEHNVGAVGHLFDKNFTHHFRAPLAPGLEGFKPGWAHDEWRFPGRRGD